MRLTRAIEATAIHGTTGQAYEVGVLPIGADVSPGTYYRGEDGYTRIAADGYLNEVSIDDLKIALGIEHGPVTTSGNYGPCRYAWHDGQPCLMEIEVPA